MNTLARNLLAWALGALVLVWATFIGSGWFAGQHEADELTDGHLASVSALLAAQGDALIVPRSAVVAGVAGSQLRAHDYQQSLSVMMWDAAGHLLAASGDAPVPRAGMPPEPGFATVQLGDPPRPWRAFVRWNEAHDRKLAVMLLLQERDSLADDIAQQIVAPGLWLLPAVVLVLGLAVWRGLRPLRQVSGQVHALDVRHPTELPAPRHRELAEVVDAINTLARRYQAALANERSLASEFAHELRTPITALALQARAAREAPDAATQQHALAAVEREVMRASDVMAQLLALARASRAELDERAAAVDLLQLATRVVAEYAPRAHAGGRDLGLVAGLPLVVAGHATLLEIALRNLVENAMAHSAPGSEIEVRVDAQAACLWVCDRPAGGVTGRPASPAVGLGLGLGHRVIEKIAAVHDATFTGPLEQGGWNCFGIGFRQAA